jgi:hypothetical protein
MIQRVFALTLAGMGMFVSVAFPCSCAEVPTVAQALESSESVFRGFVLAIEPDSGNPEHVRVTFAVNGYWKGPVKETYTVLTYGNTAGCGYGFLVGTEFLVYADASDLGEPGTGLCTRNNPIVLAAADLEELGPPAIPARATSWGALKYLLSSSN